MNISQFQLGTVKLLRYIHGGVLLALAYALLEPDSAKSTFEAIGGTFGTISLFTIGAIIYLIHKTIIGEKLIYPRMHKMHDNKDKKCKSQIPLKSPTYYLFDIGMVEDMNERRRAYTFIRRNCFLKKTESLDLAHSELHMLWITIEVTVLVYVCILIKQLHLFFFAKLSVIYWCHWLALLLLIPLFVYMLIRGTLEAEFEQLSYETRLLRRTIKESELIKCLKKADFRFSDSKPVTQESDK